MRYLVTGAAGFIGFSLSKKLLMRGHEVWGIDNIDPYYEVSLKKARINHLRNLKKKFKFKKIDISNKSSIYRIFKSKKFDRVINLAAQAGVRYSIINPDSYLKNNLIGFFNILENCKKFKIKHLLFASTSSVYGLQTKNPFKVEDSCNHPIQFYAATKKSNEMMAHSYSHLYNLPITGLRFFTVYGPWGRPDMALHKFTKNILEKKEIEVFNYGKHVRDFTYIDDIVYNIIAISNKIPKKNLKFNSKKLKNYQSSAPFRILNIGNSKPEKLMDFVKEIERNLKLKANIKYKKLQKGDIETTTSDMKHTYKLTGIKKITSIKVGVKNFIDWFLNYYNYD